MCVCVSVCSVKQVLEKLFFMKAEAGADQRNERRRERESEWRKKGFPGWNTAESLRTNNYSYLVKE